MNSKLRKVLSVVIVILVALGAFVSVFGMGSVKNIKDQLNYGLDIDGGVYVVMQASTGNKTGSDLKTTMEQTQEVLQKRVDAMETLKMDLFASQVFVFTPKGEVIDLPAGSTPLDFAFKIHTDVGCRCVGAKVNGKMVTIDHASDMRNRSLDV